MSLLVDPFRRLADTFRLRYDGLDNADDMHTARRRDARSETSVGVPLLHLQMKVSVVRYKQTELLTALLTQAFDELPH